MATIYASPRHARFYPAMFISHLDENRVKGVNNVTRRVQKSHSLGRKWMLIVGYSQNGEQNVVECRAA